MSNSPELCVSFTIPVLNHLQNPIALLLPRYALDLFSLHLPPLRTYREAKSLSKALVKRDTSYQHAVFKMSDRGAVKQKEDLQEHRASFPAEILPESKPINDTRSYRILLIAAVKLLKRICPHHGTVLFVSSKLCIKFGPLRHLPEASTMQFLAQKTSIPVPKIYCAFTRKGWTYIVMEQIHGEMAGRG